MSGQVQAGHWDKVFHTEGAGTLPRLPRDWSQPQGCQAPGAFGRHSQARGGIAGGTVQGQQLDSMTL